MTSSDILNPVALHGLLGVTKPPDTITQEAFDFNDKHLRRLAQLKPGDKADAGDLREYSEDLRYTEIQSSLLVYLLPFCLAAWRDDLKGNYGYGGFVEYLYPVLANRHIFDHHVNAEQAAAVSLYIRQAILEEIDQQRGLFYQGSRARPYRWVGALTTYGVLRPDLPSLWNAWWSLETTGRAVAAVQYLSCLMYPEYENPVFSLRPGRPTAAVGLHASGILRAIYMNIVGNRRTSRSCAKLLR